VLNSLDCPCNVVTLSCKLFMGMEAIVTALVIAFCRSPAYWLVPLNVAGVMEVVDPMVLLKRGDPEGEG
jgi:hypothetical protein